MTLPPSLPNSDGEISQLVLSTYHVNAQPIRADEAERFGRVRANSFLSPQEPEQPENV